jgi:hypothetical protein
LPITTACTQAGTWKKTVSKEGSSNKPILNIINLRNFPFRPPFAKGDFITVGINPPQPPFTKGGRFALKLMTLMRVPCQATTDASYLSFCPPAALRLRLHSAAIAMRPQLRLAGRQNHFAILRHFLLDRTLG